MYKKRRTMATAPSGATVAESAMATASGASRAESSTSADATASSSSGFSSSSSGSGAGAGALKPRAFVCETCDAQFVSAHGLNLHRRQRHGGGAQRVAALADGGSAQSGSGNTSSANVDEPSSSSRSSSSHISGARSGSAKSGEKRARGRIAAIEVSAAAAVERIEIEMGRQTVSSSLTIETRSI
jgi:hypothetical protein